MKISPEILYNYWYKKIMLVTKNIRVKDVRNFENAKAKDYWEFFEKATELINRNEKQIDYKLFVDSIIDYTKTWFHPRVLVHRSSLTIYRNFIDRINNSSTNEPTKIKETITEDCKFIIRYCIDNKIQFSEYLYENASMIPTFLQHISSGSVSKSFVSVLPESTVHEIFSTYPLDVTNDYFIDYMEKWNSIRKVLQNSDFNFLLKKEFFDKISSTVAAQKFNK